MAMKDPYTAEMDFFQAVRLWQRWAAQESAGEDPPQVVEVHPQAERIRFRTSPTQRFPAAEVANVEDVPPVNCPPHTAFEVAFLGLFGNQSALPWHDAERAVRSEPFRIFLSVFNHRLIGLFYQAWAKNHFFVGFENRVGERTLVDVRGDLVELMYSLVGLRRATNREQLAFPVTPLLRHLLALSGCHRGQSALVEILTAFFPGIDLVVKEFAPTYLKIDPSQATACNSRQPTPASCLGVGTVVGYVITDYQSKFRICLGPISYREFQTFLPGGKRFRELTDLVKYVVGISTEFDVQFIIAKDDIPPVEMKTRASEATASRPLAAFQMGRNTWLSSKPLATDRDDPIFQVKM